MSYDTLRKAADLAMLHFIAKQAGGESLQYLAHGLDVARKVPDILVKGFGTMGEEATKALAMPGQDPGTIAKALGWGIKHVPHAAAVAGGAKLVEPHIAPYMNAKLTELQARMAASQPYFDPATQRYM